MPECPVVGCSTEFGKPESVAAHVQGSGEVHKGYSRSDAMDALDAGSELEPEGEGMVGEDNYNGSEGGRPEDPTQSDGPPEVDNDNEVAPCGCELDPAELSDGVTYRCTDHNAKFTYYNE